MKGWARLSLTKPPSPINTCAATRSCRDYFGLLHEWSQVLRGAKFSSASYKTRLFEINISFQQRLILL
ncbi:hypothetical protein KPH14_012002 [Odynerus spinipes]|uniref:Uncharacterized protein n=1 Tax=Odynerus spinipes TaxID=1348599 RepID=A0AAD9RDM2_9HYME|nr:hypothetical protein KPH14_012002 [Odynerus spinipes]